MALPAMVRSFLPQSQPWIARHSYRWELVQAMTMPVAFSLVEGSVVSVLAKKAFGVGPFAFAALMAAPMFANLTSFGWTRLSRGRRKAPFLAVLCLASLLCVAAVATLPTTELGGVLLVLLVIATRCLMAGIITVRSVVWRHNYPRRLRATVTGRLWLITTLLLTVAPLGAYYVLDRSEQAFRVAYPAAALIGVVGALAMARVRVRGEKALLRFEREATARPQRRGERAPLYEYDPRSPRVTKPTFWRVLREDRFFRRYMAWQFLVGVCFMSCETLAVLAVANLTDALPNEYLLAILLTTAIPMSMSVATLPIWSRFLDRISIVRFRVRQGGFWITMAVAYFVGASLAHRGELALGLAVIAVGRLTAGLARAGGMLAWQLGHNDFASRHMVSVYMGIHVTLTGVRGATAPFVAVLLYDGWESGALRWLGVPSVPAFAGLGPPVFLLLLGGIVVALVGFARLDRAMTRAGRHELPKNDD